MEPHSNDLQALLTRARELPVDGLPRLLGDLREVEAIAMARLLTATAPVAAPQADQLLDAAEAGRRLGAGVDYLYHNHGRYPFTRRVGRRLLFSAEGIASYIRGTTIPPSRRRRISPVRNPATRRNGQHEQTQSQ